jgi:hypothetical protein
MRPRLDLNPAVTSNFHHLPSSCRPLFLQQAASSKPLLPPRDWRSSRSYSTSMSWPFTCASSSPVAALRASCSTLSPGLRVTYRSARSRWSSAEAWGYLSLLSIPAPPCSTASASATAGPCRTRNPYTAASGSGNRSRCCSLPPQAQGTP